MKIFLPIIILAVSACIDLSGRQNKAHIVDSMANTLLKQHPDAQIIMPEELKAEDVLVDIRNPNERLVSTLPNAISKDDFLAKFDEFKDRRIIAYDTIGQRSIPWVTELNQQGLSAYSLRGGILAWAHHGGVFVDTTNQETKRVHVFSEAWDMLPEGFEAITQ
tara:strand:- start:1081 stop:1569 length:489 start_codon:yes stop_codon:yes gene_type:complete